MAWTAATSKSLWADWMSRRYFPKTAIWSSTTTKIGSCIWRKVRNSAQLVQAGCNWTIGNEKLADLWFDCWTVDSTFEAQFSSFSFPLQQKVSSLWDGSAWIILSGLQIEVEEALRNVVQNLSIVLDIKDSITWKSHPGQGFVFKEAWQLIRSRRNPRE